MSKKNLVNNPLPALGKSTKKGKKQAIDEIDDFIKDQSDISPMPSSSSQAPRLKKLKKAGDKNKKQEERFIKQKSQSQYISEEEDDSQQREENFQKFQRLNDEQIEEVQKQMKNKKSKKKTKKGEQQIDKFIQKHKGQQQSKKLENKPSKSQSTTQMSLKAMFQSGSQPKKSPQTNFTQQNNSGSSSDSEDQMQLYRKRQQMAKLNNGDLNQEQAIKIAMMESLKEMKKEQTPISNYAFQKMMNSGRQQPQKKKQQIKKEEIKKKQEIKKQQKKQEKKPAQSKQARQRQKSVGKKEKQQKQSKQGPFKGIGVVLTGEFEPYSKNKILQLLEELGAQLPKSVTKKTNYLLQGSFIVNSFGRRTDQDVKTTGKSVEAAQKNVTIIPFQKLDDFFIQKTGKSLQQNMQKDKPIKQTRLDQKLIQIPKNFSQQASSAAKTTAFDQPQPQPIPQITNISLPWTQKHKPKSSQQIIGQSSQIKNLREWLQIWQDIHIRGNKRQVKQTFNSFMPAGNINSNAALLSGDAGLGKTTAARLVAAEFGYSVIEYNASDARNKKSVQLISVGKNNLSFLVDRSKEMRKTLIIMDQVDGMSSGDRGGITAIIDMIKKTKVPIICICNDRQAMKIRSLAGHCFDIKFYKPDQRLIVKRLEKIIESEGGTSSSVALKSIVELLQNDIRQILTYLQVIFKGGIKNINEDVIRKKCGNTKDNSLTINHFEATKILLSRTMFKQMSISQRVDLSYVDSDMVPLMVHQNYLDACPKKKLNSRQFRKLACATEGFAMGDRIDRTIMKNQNYCLMPNKMFLTCVYPSEMICQNVGFPKFTEWLGKFSSERKNKRLVKQLKYTLNCVSSVTFQSVKNHYAPMLLQRIYHYLRASEPNNDDIVQFMMHYGITPAILNEHLTDLQFSKQRQNLLKNIDSIKKTKLTKAFNKKYETLKVKKGKKKAIAAQHMKFDPVLGQMEHESQEEQQLDEKQNQDSEIIVEKKPAKSKAKKK